MCMECRLSGYSIQYMNSQIRLWTTELARDGISLWFDTQQDFNWTRHSPVVLLSNFSSAVRGSPVVHCFSSFDIFAECSEEEMMMLWKTDECYAVWKQIHLAPGSGVVGTDSYVSGWLFYCHSNLAFCCVAWRNAIKTGWHSLETVPWTDCCRRTNSFNRKRKNVCHYGKRESKRKIRPCMPVLKCWLVITHGLKRYWNYANVCGIFKWAHRQEWGWIQFLIKSLFKCCWAPF